MKQKELYKIIELHEEWLAGSCDSKRADLSNEDLSNVDLSNADLSYANLSGADLEYANLSGANLSNANLSNANLNNANLNNADLSSANLNSADLNDANLIVTNLSNANLNNANLSGADLNDANLSKAILNWVSWHETRGLKVYEAQLNSSRENAQLAYTPSLDAATTGCWQNTWEATKKRVADVYKESNPKIYKKYQLAFQYIEDQMVEDN